MEVEAGLYIPGKVHACKASARTSTVRSSFFMKTTILVSVGGVKARFVIGFYGERVSLQGTIRPV